MIERILGCRFLECLLGAGKMVGVVCESIVIFFFVVDGTSPSYFANFRL